MQALVVRDLRLVAGLDERLESEPDELRDAAAEHRLLAEQVALGLLDERGLDHARTCGADPGRVGEREPERVPARVLGDGDERRRAVPLGEEPADDVARPLRRDHDHVVARRRLDAPVMDVEPVGEEQCGARSQVRRDVGLVDRGLDLVRKQKRDDLGAGGRLGDRADGEPRFLGGSPRAAALPEPDLDLDARVVQVQGMCVALAAVADDRDLAVEEAEVAFAVNRCHGTSFQLTDRWR